MEKRDKKLNFWVTDEEYKKISANAERFGLSVSTYLRLLGMSGMQPFVGSTGLGVVGQREIPRVTQVEMRQPGQEPPRKERRRAQ